MAEAAHELIIIRRHEDEEHEHHSSAWKVAHADFMTAMMAFFLIMWLINATDDEIQKGISLYFNPLHMSSGSADLKGLGKPGDAQEPGKGKKDVPLPGAALNILKMQPAGSGDTQEVSEEEAATALKAVAEIAAKLGGKAGGDAGDKAAGEIGGDLSGAKGGPDADGSAAVAAVGDREAFQDPYAVLTKLAEQYAATHGSSPYAVDGDIRRPGANSGILERDPFDPAYWQAVPLPPARAEQPGEPSRRKPIPGGVMPDAAVRAAEAGEVPAAATGLAERPLALIEPPAGAGGLVPDAAVMVSRGGDSADADGLAVLPPGPIVQRAPVETPPPPPGSPGSDARPSGPDAAGRTGDALVNAGGPAAPPVPPGRTDPRPPEPGTAVAAAAPPAPAFGATASPDGPAAAPRSAPQPASPEAMAEAQSLATQIEGSVREMMTAEPSPTLSVTATGEGVVINLTDDATYAMFGIGSAVPDGKTVVLLERVARVLADRPGAIVVRGFTDGRPFRSPEYDNWRLSAARAHMAYYMLVRGGLDEARVVSIEGHADRNLKNPADSYAAENRRIEILLKEKGQ